MLMSGFRRVSTSRPGFFTKPMQPRSWKRTRQPGYVCKPITLGANTDPYQPVERRMQVTRSILEVLARTRHPLTIITKNALVLRDLDLLAELARDGLASVAVSVTSLERNSSARSSRAPHPPLRACAP